MQTMKNRLLVSVMAYLTFSLVHAYDAQINGIYYNLDNHEKTAEVTYGESRTASTYKGSVVIPTSVTYSGNRYAVTAIGSDAFYNCRELTSLTLPSSINKITGSFTFANCLNLEAVHISDLEAWCNISFTDAASNPLYKNYTKAALYLNGELVKDLVIPDGVTTISDYAFVYFGNDNLSRGATVTIPKSVTTIGKYAFWQSGMYALKLGENILEIGDFAFYHCTNLQTIDLPKKLTTIGQYAFCGCYSVTSLVIPDNVATINEGAFSNMSRLASIKLPKGLTAISNYAFSGLESLTLLEIPEGVKTIGEGAIQTNRKMASVVIPSSVESIGQYAFFNCMSLKDVNCKAKSVPTASENTFYLYEDATLHVPAASVSLYEEAEPWKNFKAVVPLDDIQEKQQCSIPTIEIVNGRLKLSCETEGVIFKTSFSFEGGNGTAEGDDIPIAATTICHFNVYATKEGYYDSKTVTKDITVNIGIGENGDINTDGIINVSDIVGLTKIILQK